ncbi:leucyl/phenylalanyl-tRNA--protein transferase [Nocardioides hwasunensis]|uniref:Leucyl/phenylalanyl-tRNA--protein transferase n=1 Tax=Nocardioides hwasunensis TaxID=397258 RepID=A0ABR8MK76_9ACTN|nr:leucyl/phenylalanyl-tRNA--protein transferase [Nocardioides hwasunensis]MBD3916397.1 leucyl/phenylalanyl-tRNA--protein transferase [Nocardioides hwasunensis]
MPIAPAPTPWAFPHHSTWDPDDDLVALGADLDSGTLVTAYGLGLFPMPVTLDGDEQLGWFSPVERGVLPLDGMKVSRSLRRSARDFEIRIDSAFDEVLAQCGSPDRPDGWITPAFRQAYGRLHRLGWAHSVEAWRDDELVGGLYGVSIGGLFAGESMFHRERDASKVALLALVELLDDGHAEQRVLDVQWQTPHLASLGVVRRQRGEYLEQLEQSLRVPLPAAFRMDD